MFIIHWQVCVHLIHLFPTQCIQGVSCHTRVVCNQKPQRNLTLTIHMKIDAGRVRLPTSPFDIWTYEGITSGSAKYLLVVEIHIIILDIYAFPTTGRSNVRTMTLVKLIFLSSRMLNRDLHQGRPWLASSAVSDKERCRPTVRSSLHMVAERESGCTALLNSTVHG